MAASKSSREGQFPICCNLCENERKISWKCIDCDLMMCNGCKGKIHINIRNARNHNVIDIKEVGVHSEEFNFSNIHCKKHKGQVCIMFCKSCDLLVCTQCIAKAHTDHELVEMNEGCKIKIKKLMTSADTLAKEETNLKDIQKAENAKFNKCKKQILGRNESLKTYVDQHTEELLTELDQKWDSSKNSIENVESKVISLMKNQNDKKQQIKDIINSNNAEQIFEECDKLEESLKEVSNSLEIDPNSTPIFVPGEISHYNVGSVQNMSRNITLQVIKEYTTDISGIYRISPGVDSLWISDRKVVQKVQPEVNTLKVISSLDIEIMDMAVTPSNDLLLAARGNSVLKQISVSTNKLIDTNYSVDPQCVTAVHVTSDYKVIVGIMDFGKTFPATGRRAVILMDKEGKNKTIYEYDGNNQRIFTFPGRITNTHNGNICVVDRLSFDKRGRIVLLDQDGDILNFFHGHPKIDTEVQSFKPLSVQTTPSDNIIVSELKTNVLYILTNEGHYMTHFNTKDIGIISPISIAFTTKGQMYIGRTDNAKVYEVKQSGC